MLNDGHSKILRDCECKYSGTTKKKYELQVN